MFSVNTRAKKHLIIRCNDAFTQIQKTHCPKISPRSKIEAGLAFSRGTVFSSENGCWLKTEIELQKPVLTELVSQV